MKSDNYYVNWHYTKITIIIPIFLVQYKKTRSLVQETILYRGIENQRKIVEGLNHFIIGTSFNYQTQIDIPFTVFLKMVSYSYFSSRSLIEFSSLFSFPHTRIFATLFFRVLQEGRRNMYNSSCIIAIVGFCSTSALSLRTDASAIVFSFSNSNKAVMH